MAEAYNIDLHIHTCLSPCADLTMLPTAIIKQAKAKNLDMIGICDHNSMENVQAVKKAGKKYGIPVIGGIEITSSEEVNIMEFFKDETKLKELQKIIYQNLPGDNDVDIFGDQIVVDENDNPVNINNRLLIGATLLTVEKIVDYIQNLEGIAIAAHIDRKSYSIIGQLGFKPKELSLDGLELSVNCKAGEIKNYKDYNLPIIKSSDAHYLEDIGRASTAFYLESPCFQEICMACRNKEGRRIEI